MDVLFSLFKYSIAYGYIVIPIIHIFALGFNIRLSRHKARACFIWYPRRMQKTRNLLQNMKSGDNLSINGLIREVCMLTRMKRIMWNERYLAVVLGIFAYTLFPLLSRMWRARGDGILYAYTAFEEAFVFSFLSSDYYLPFAYVAPLVGSVVCGNLYLDDLRNGCVALMCIRESKARYHIRNLVAVAVSCSLLFLIPLGLNLIVSMIGFPLSNSMMASSALATTAYHNPYRDFGEANVFNLLQEHHPYIHISMRLLANSLLYASFAILNYGLSVFARFKKYINNLIIELVFAVLVLYFNYCGGNFSFVTYLLASESMMTFLCLCAVVVCTNVFAFILLICGMRRRA